MKFEVNYPLERKNYILLRISGRLDADTVSALEEKLEDIISDQSHIIIVSNMKDVEYAASGGIRVLVKYAKRISNRGGKFALTDMNRKVSHTFDMLGFGELFCTYKTEAEALKNLE